MIQDGEKRVVRRKSAKRPCDRGHDRRRCFRYPREETCVQVFWNFHVRRRGRAGGCAVSAPAYADGPIVGLITKTNTNPFFVKMKQGFEAKAKELGLTPQSYAGKFDGDNDGQVEAIEQLMAAGAKGILLVPSDSTAIVPTVKKARDAGILVITLDTPLDPPTAADANFATDNFKAGELIGAWAKATLGDKAKDGQDRHPRPGRQRAVGRLLAPQRLPHRLRHPGQGCEALRAERQPADRRLRRDAGLDRRRPQGDGEHPAEGRPDRPRLRDQRAIGLWRLCGA